MKYTVQMESEPMTLVECLGQRDEARSEAGALRDALDAVVPEIERLRANARDLAAERERMCAAIKAAERERLMCGDFFTHDRTGVRFVCRAVTRRHDYGDSMPMLRAEIELAPN